jgi:hypothetical protein
MPGAANTTPSAHIHRSAPKGFDVAGTASHPLKGAAPGHIKTNSVNN